MEQVASSFDDLCTLYNINRGSRDALGRTAKHYSDTYARILEPVRNEPINILEIGSRLEGSVRTWLAYLPKARILAIDSGPAAKSSTGERFRVVACHLEDAASLTQALSSVWGTFDIIVDDAPFLKEVRQGLFERLFHLLKADGLYLLEDFHAQRELEQLFLASLCTQLASGGVQSFETLPNMLLVRAGARECRRRVRDGCQLGCHQMNVAAYDSKIRDSERANRCGGVDCDVIVVFDHDNAHWLRASLESILHQTMANCTLHVVRDGGSWGLIPEISKWLDGIPQVRRYLIASSVGPFVATNLVLPNCTSEYLCIQDSDDLSLPSRVWRSVTLLQKKGGDIYGATMEQFLDYESRSDPVLQDILRNHRYHCSGIPWRTAPRGGIVNGTMVVRRDTFVSMNGFGDFVCAGDCEFATRAHVCNKRIVVCDDVVALRRLHRDSLSFGMRYGPKTGARAALERELVGQYADYIVGMDPARFGRLREHCGRYKLEQL